MPKPGPMTCLPIFELFDAEAPGFIAQLAVNAAA